MYFVNGESSEFDNIVLCTGYQIDLPFLAENLHDRVLDLEHNDVKVSMAVARENSTCSCKSVLSDFD